MTNTPDFSFEAAAPHTPVAGVDEAGRGPWAGPVVAGAVILDPAHIPAGLNDSKKLSANKREALYEAITAQHQWGAGIASAAEIDALNILQATKLAMQRAVAALPTPPGYVLIDGNHSFDAPCPTNTVVKGDSRSLSIAAASIIAKVTRDRMMQDLHKTYPHYGWDSNAGYGTKQHQEGLAVHGITPEHRKSFAPIRAIVNAQQEAA